ncbi:hypothetical protein BU25DRAFT_441152 [Macroventuria anomochaeta]|uniref:Uncharacterized protein n=1 Tax=Macroventuria anomochaeta TaxID=301207 RepID=A0ACB6RXB6_9PLEO|nr:uncharacterized protein BU25DRAFT_441152 [Macroventuria anomochaeta]KAF2626065.1 hypothetical protein BU25DRAFT_441152 [Macroventuria anomochaeta]
MDPQTDLPDLVEDLEVNIDELSGTLTPLLPPNTLSKTATSLPLLEKAKLYVLAAYAIESVLFSSLQASGADAKSHALFAELGRLKGYFAKIKDAEENAAGPRQRLDRDAAARFIKHGLSGNERYDEMRKERMAKEKEHALEKARATMNRKFDEEETPKKRGAAEGGEEQDTPAKKAKLAKTAAGEEDEDLVDTPATAPKKRSRKTKQTAEAEEEQEDAAEGGEAMDVDSPAPARKKRGRPSKKDKAAASVEAAPPQETGTPTRATRSSAPKTRSEAECDEGEREG